MNALLVLHTHYPTKIATTLASPRKRGGGTADIIFWPAVQYSDSPTFMILKLFRAVTVGIAPHPHHHWDFPHYPTKTANTLSLKWTLCLFCIPAIVVAKPTKHSCRDREPAFLKKTDFFYKLKLSRYRAWHYKSRRNYRLRKHLFGWAVLLDWCFYKLCRQIQCSCSGWIQKAYNEQLRVKT